MFKTTLGYQRLRLRGHYLAQPNVAAPSRSDLTCSIPAGSLIVERVPGVAVLG